MPHSRVELTGPASSRITPHATQGSAGPGHPILLIFSRLGDLGHRAVDAAVQQLLPPPRPRQRLDQHAVRLRLGGRCQLAAVRRQDALAPRCRPSRIGVQAVSIRRRLDPPAGQATARGVRPIRAWERSPRGSLGSPATRSFGGHLAHRSCRPARGGAATRCASMLLERCAGGQRAKRAQPPAAAFRMTCDAPSLHAGGRSGGARADPPAPTRRAPRGDDAEAVLGPAVVLRQLCRPWSCWLGQGDAIGCRVVSALGTLGAVPGEADSALA